MAPRGRVKGVPAEADRGDTLVEVLVALIIVSISVVALLGGLLTTMSTSVTHRGITNLDSVLRSVAETARYQIQTQSSFGPGSGPQFKQCATTSDYTVVSAPYPSTGPANTTSATVFTLGLTPTTVTVGGQAATITSTSGGPSGATVTFTVPTLATGYYPVTVNGSTAATDFQVTAAGSQVDTTSLAGYTLDATMEYWDGSAFQSTGCTADTANSDVQQLGLTLSENQNGNAAIDDISVVLSDFKPLAVPTISEVCTSGCTGTTGTLGQTFTLLVTVSGTTGVPTPSGSVTCPTGGTQPLTAGTATCTVSNPTPGSYSATYSGDTYYAGGRAKPAITVPKYTPTMSQPSMLPASPVAGQTITFTSTFSGVAGYAPTGQVTWTGPCSGSTGLTWNGSAYQSQCVETNAAGGSYSESAAYVAGSDPNYTDSPTSSALTFSVLYSGTPVMTVSPSSPPTAPATLTFTATITQPAGAPAPTGTITWSGIPTGAGCLSSAPLPAKSPYSVSCTVSNASGGSYTATATYSGDTNYAPGNSSQSITVLYPGTPGLTMSPKNPAKNTDVTFTATITQPTGAPAPTGTITWSGVPTGASCTSPAQLPTTATSTGSYSVTCLYSKIPAGNYTVTATYSGDPNYAGGSSSISFKVPNK